MSPFLLLRMSLSIPSHLGVRHTRVESSVSRGLDHHQDSFFYLDWRFSLTRDPNTVHHRPSTRRMRPTQV